MNKKIKLFLKILLGIIIVLLLSIIIIFIVHKIKSNVEYNQLEKLGYINKYSAGEYNLNLYRVGNKNSKYKLIAISGLGINDYSIEMSTVNDYLKDDYELIFIDRAGVGYSDDTSKKQTIEQIVSDYRTALKNANITGSYILLPHSFGGVYATYWESIYPNEIDGVIYIDSTALENDNNTVEGANIMHYLLHYASVIGFQRLALHNFYPSLPSTFNQEQQELSDHLNVHYGISKANISEVDEKSNNINTAFKKIKSNNIPKLYISSSYGFKTIDEYKKHIDWKKKYYKESKTPDINYSNEDIKKELNNCNDMINNKIIPYINSLGNAELKLLAGDHLIFMERPEELANIIKEFISKFE